MKGKRVLYIDQYGQHLYARTVKELRQLCGGGRVSRMFHDVPLRGTFHTGYVVGSRWFTAFIPYEGKA